MLNIICFKWAPYADQLVTIPSQNVLKYMSTHINTFYNMVERNVTIPHKVTCVTDDPGGLHPDINVVPLWDKYRQLGGCYNRLFVFSNEAGEILGNRFACLDIDMVITSNIDSLLSNEADFVYYRAPGPDGKGGRLNGGMFMMNAGCRSFVWDEFNTNPKQSIDLSKSALNKWPAGTDQAWMNYRLNIDFESYWGTTDGIYDMRQHFIETGRVDLPDNCKIVMWPGPRDPSQPEWHKKYKWINENYR